MKNKYFFTLCLMWAFASDAASGADRCAPNQPYCFKSTPEGQPILYTPVEKLENNALSFQEVLATKETFPSDWGITKDEIRKDKLVRLSRTLEEAQRESPRYILTCDNFDPLSKDSTELPAGSQTGYYTVPQTSDDSVLDTTALKLCTAYKFIKDNTNRLAVVYPDQFTANYALGSKLNGFYRSANGVIYGYKGGDKGLASALAGPNAEEVTEGRTMAP